MVENKKILIVYITCESVAQAERIGKILLEKKLGICVNIVKEEKSMYLWPPKTGKVEEVKEVCLLVKTLESKYKDLEAHVISIHTYDVPCILAIPVIFVNESYSDWIRGELS